MTEVLKIVQALQAEAFAKDVYAFDITTRCLKKDDDEYPKFIIVYIFLKGDDTDKDYFSTEFYQFDGEDAVEGKIQEIKNFINL